MLYIDVPDNNDSFSRVVLDGREFLIRFTYNASFDYWSFGVYDLEERPILAMCKIIPGSPLTHFYGSLELPGGIFGVLTNLERADREAFNTRKAQFVFIPKSDLAE